MKIRKKRNWIMMILLLKIKKEKPCLIYIEIKILAKKIIKKKSKR